MEREYICSVMPLRHDDALMTSPFLHSLIARRISAALGATAALIFGSLGRLP